MAAVAATVDDTPDPEQVLRRGRRIAGIALIINGLLGFVEIVFGDAGQPSLLRSPVPYVIDFLLAATLLQGKEKYIGFVLFRAVVGGTVFLGLHLTRGEHMLAFCQVLYSAAIIATLWRAPSPKRLHVAIAGLVLCFGVPFLYGATNATALTLAEHSHPLGPDRKVRGNSHAYSLVAPSDEWRLLKSDSALRGGVVADQWMVHPKHDLHVLVTAESVDPARGTLDPSKYVSLVKRRVSAALTDFRLLDDAALPTDLRAGHMLEYSGVQDGMKLHYVHALYVQDNTGFEVMAWGDEKRFPAVTAELRALVTSMSVESQLTHNGAGADDDE